MRGIGHPVRPISERIMDVVLSTIVLVLLCPLMLVIAIAIKLESPGRAIYRSRRVGKCGRKFDCYKFRTMVCRLGQIEGQSAPTKPAARALLQDRR